MATDITGISHVALSCRDLEASERWYTDVLGFTHLADMEAEDYQRKLLIHPGGVVVGLQQHDGNSGEAFGPSRTGLDHLAFSVAQRADLDEWSQRFAELGVTHSPVAETPWGQVLCFRDPDDIQLELFWFPGGG
jgi:glyoxylase I family protein